MKKLFIMGATGSIGTQTLDLLKKSDQLIGFSFNQNLAKAIEIAIKYQPKYIICKKEFHKHFKALNIQLFEQKDEENLFKTLDKNIKFINSVSGVAGIKVSVDILNSYHDLFLANKESMVVYGEKLNSLKNQNKVRIIPIDSEHNSLLKLLYKTNLQEVDSLIITSSGGSLRDYPLDKINEVGIREVLNHPTWSMGQIITVDSATMVNKAYEVIEASQLFNIPINKIKAIIQKESIIHAFITYVDGSIEAAMSFNDMRQAIDYALNYPHYKENDLPKLSLFTLKQLNFDQIDDNRYPLYKTMLHHLEKRGFEALLAVKADEIAVKMFLNGNIKFSDIAVAIEKIIDKYLPQTRNLDFNLENIQKIISLLEEK